MTPPRLAETNLFKPITVGAVTLQNRLVFAPTSRFRMDDNHSPTDLVKKYYEARSENNGGLIIVEGAFVSPQAGFFWKSPMIYTDKQVEAWETIADSIHSKGSFVSLQIYYRGRVGDPKKLKEHGLPLLGPSAIYLDEESEKAAIAAGNPLRSFTVPEIKQLITEFKEATIKAIKLAGFDFVEIHVGYMYALAQFVDIATNQRTDEYGGSIEKRSKIVLEIVDEVVAAVGAKHVGIRVSPYIKFQGGSGGDSKLMHPIAQYAYLFSELERRAKEVDFSNLARCVD
ncbi:unnamed protein product [Ambrosiozyma monospora]|uniref:Unnamed protein product n=1 Tax=Ambrosiozyma monospora TaxID=43982 RepID=A0ACB5T7P8_AMBMO|nr:unnamed protein product [Ambrosiozyma monospora]